MAIFGNKTSSKNKVYYRRKSIRLSNIALWSAGLVVIAVGVYSYFNRG